MHRARYQKFLKRIRLIMKNKDNCLEMIFLFVLTIASVFGGRGRSTASLPKHKVFKKNLKKWLNRLADAPKRLDGKTVLILTCIHWKGCWCYLKFCWQECWICRWKYMGFDYFCCRNFWEIYEKSEKSKMG